MKDGDSWADGLGGTGGKTESSRSVIETVEKNREEDSCYCVDRPLLSVHMSLKPCSVRHRQRLMSKHKQNNSKQFR